MGDIERKVYFDALLLEYKSIRDEISSTTAEFYKILQYGSAVTLGFIGVGFSLWLKEHAIVMASFGFLIPTLTFLFIEMLMGQIARIRRAGLYCKRLEDKLHMLVGDSLFDPGVSKTANFKSRDDDVKFFYPIGWETWLHDNSSRNANQPHFMWIYRVATAFFVIVSSVCLTVNIYYYLEFWKDPNYSILRFWTGTRNEILIATLIFLTLPLEVLKTSFWLNQARQIANPLVIPVPLFRLFRKLPNVSATKKTKQN